MNQPRESAITGAISVLGAISSVEELATAAAALTDGLGLQRYTILDVRRGFVGGLYHNAPPSLHSSIERLRSIGDDPITARVRSSRIPFDWRCEPDTWRERGADLGYRSGVAAGSFDPVGTGCVVILSSAGAEVPQESVGELLSFTLMASLQLTLPLSRFPSSQDLECPFTQRELDCLLYALAGKSMKETARALGIGARTVEDYLGRARFRLGAASSYAAATTALRRGWIDMQQASELAGLGPAAGAGHVG